MILEGEDAGKGRFNHLLKTIKKNMPQYTHVDVNMNWARFWHEMDNQTNFCNIFAFKSGKREKVVYFSKPHTFVLPNAIIMRKSTIEKLGNPKRYSIVALLKDRRFEGVAEKNRSFSASFDLILKQYEPGSNLLRVGASAASIVGMVASGRVDYTIEYPIVAAFYGKKWSRKVDALSSIPIIEMDTYANVHMACTKNEWGRKIIDQWNAALDEIKPGREYRRLTEMGHTDKGELEIIRQNYNAFIQSD